MTQLLPKTGKSSCTFVTLALFYGEKSSIAKIPATSSPAELAAKIKEEGDKLGFDGWSGRNEWIDHQPTQPDAEVPPESTSLNTGICSVMDTPPYYSDPDTGKKFSDFSGTDGKFSGCEKTQRALQLADVYTPETTYVLVGAYDERNPSDYPKDVSNSIVPLLKPYGGVFAETYNSECKGGKFKSLFFEGKKYRYFIFYEFSHGNHQLITVGISYSEIWDTFKSMTSKQRVFGMYDSCDSGSMIVGAGMTSAGGSPTESRPGGMRPTYIESIRGDGLMSYLRAKFDRRAQLMEAVTGGAVTAAEVAQNVDARMILWSSTEDYHYGWYQPTSGTVFIDAIKSALNTVKDKRFGWGTGKTGNDGEGEGAFREVQLCGWYHKGAGNDDECVPQCAFYPDGDHGANSFAKNRIFY